ncbi:MAG TPA: radical SAM protein [Vicinamibacterales bacterium]|nr:radical SAM protein [Vicinamibacterales bacterium]
MAPPRSRAVLAVPRWFTQRPIQPMGLLYLASMLRNAGHEVRVVDGEVDALDPSHVADIVASERPEFFGITSTTAQATRAFALAEEVKRRTPGTFVTLGGPHASSLPERSLEECGALDAVVVGEGERTILEIMEGLGSRASLEGVAGTAYRDGEEIVVNPPRALIEDLDTIPFPAWDLIPMHKYVASTWFPNGVKQYTNIFTSRGCPYGCTFCGAKTTSTRKFRARSPENVIAEMEEVYRRFGIPNFFISDDLFTLKRQRVLDICALILEKKLPITWTCLSRVNTIDAEMLALMKRAGCYLISYGLESGSQAVLDKLKKGTTVEQGIQAVEMTKAAGIKVFGSFMIGSPGDTPETVEETIALIRRLKLDEVGLGVTTAYPGTDLFDAFGSDAKGLDWDKALAFNPSAADRSDVFLKCTDLDDEQIRRLFHKAMRQSVLYNPRLLVRRLSHIASVRHLGQSARAAARIFWG